MIDADRGADGLRVFQRRGWALETDREGSAPNAGIAMIGPGPIDIVGLFRTATDAEEIVGIGTGRREDHALCGKFTAGNPLPCRGRLMAAFNVEEQLVGTPRLASNFWEQRALPEQGNGCAGNRCRCQELGHRCPHDAQGINKGVVAMPARRAVNPRKDRDCLRLGNGADT